MFNGTSADCSLGINLSGLMRGDYEMGWKAHDIAVTNNILDANEVRDFEGWNPRAATPATKPVVPAA